MNHHFYITVSGLLFLLIGLLHGLRAFYGWEILVSGWLVPLWVSWLATLIGFLMAISSLKMLR